MKRDCCIVLVLVSILSLIPADAFLVPASPLRTQASSLLTMEATKVTKLYDFPLRAPTSQFEASIFASRDFIVNDDLAKNFYVKQIFRRCVVLGMP